MKKKKFQADQLPPKAQKIVTTAELGQFIRLARRWQGLTQEDVAKYIGISQRALSELERGKKTAQIGLALKILKAMGLDLKISTRSGLG